MYVYSVPESKLYYKPNTKGENKDSYPINFKRP